MSSRFNSSYFTEDEYDEDLYTILKVHKSATEKDIRSAYFALASSLHPDKIDHFNVTELRERARKLAKDSEVEPDVSLQSLRLKADEQFQYIDRAFRVLSDPQKRYAYDELGIPGVKAVEALSASTQTSALTTLSTPAQLRAIMIQMLKEEKQRLMEGSIGAQGTLTVNCYLKGLKNSYEPFHFYHLAPVTSRIASQQAVTFPISENTNMVLGGFAVSSATASRANATVSFRHSKRQRDWVMVSSDIGFDPKISLSKGFSVTKKTSGNFTVSLDSSGPGFLCGVSDSRNAFTESEVVWGLSNSGPHTSFHINKVQQDVISNVKADLSINKEFAGISMVYARSFTKRTRGNCGIKVGLQGIELSLDVVRILTSITSSKVGIKVGLNGISVLIQFQRGEMKFQCPILLCKSFDPIFIASAAIISTAVDAAVRLAVQPTIRAAAAEMQLEVEAESKRLMRSQRHRAAAANQIQLMLSSSQKKKVAELQKGGLVILSARYGTDLHIDFGEEWFLQPTNTGKNIDVTIPLQFFVSGSSLMIPDGNKSKLLGFYDVADSKSHEVALYVRYDFAGRIFEVTVKDFEPLILPSSKACYLGNANTVQ